MKSLLKLKWGILVLAAMLASCSEEDPSPVYPLEKDIYVVSEGGFNANNGTIGFYNREESQSDIFQTVNGRILGDIVQDFEIVDTLGFIVVNNSQKVEVVNMKDFSSVATIDNAALTYPRFVEQATENTIYVSNGSMAGEVLIFNTQSFELTGSITVGNGPEMMVKVDNKMYVANSGGWNVDNTISVIDIDAGEVVETIEVGYASVTMKADKDNNLWVYSKGAEVDANRSPTAPHIYKIDTNTDEVVKDFSINKTLASWGSNLLATSADGYVYYFADATYKLGINDDELPTEAWSEIAYYGIDVDPELGYIYCMDGNNSGVIIYNSDATEVLTISQTGAFPRAIVFSN